MNPSILRKSAVGEIDWGGILDTVVKSTANTVQSIQQTKALQAQANASMAAAQAAQASGWGYPATTTQTSTINKVLPILLIGGLAVGAFMLLRKKRR